jgi:hypothetical protein
VDEQNVTTAPYFRQGLNEGLANVAIFWPTRALPRDDYGAGERVGVLDSDVTKELS